MPWFKVDDQLAFHSKTMLAGNGAMGLWVRAGSWASATLTDGFIPAHMAHAMGEDDQIQQLLTAGMWDETDGGYVFHDWDEFQPSAEQEKRLRKERSEAGKAGARARWASKPDGKPDGKSHSTRHGNPMASAMANGWQTDAPSRPVPSPTSSPLPNENPTTPETPQKTTRRRPELPLPSNWMPTKSHHDYAQEHHLNLQEEATAFRGHAETHDRRVASWNAAFATWLRKAKPTTNTNNHLWD